jgi:large-conductance mechanosensitive channel
MIIALSIFVIIKLINKAQDTIIKKEKKEEIIEMQKKSDDLLVLEEIRDLLKTQKTVKKEAK